MVNRKQRIAANEISLVKSYSLAGHEQKVMLEGRYKELPLLLFLHGGPGFPLPYGVGSRGAAAELTDQFTLVCWDQLGCGCNDHPAAAKLTVQDYIEMTVTLIEKLKQEFPQQPLYLFATSWGSVLAAEAARQRPHLIKGVTVFGQVIKQLTFNEDAYTLLQQAPLKAAQQARLAEISSGQEVTIANLKQLLRWLQKYTDGYQYRQAPGMALLPMLGSLLFSPDYRLPDLKAVLFNQSQKNERLLLELIQMDLSDCLSEITIPYHIFQGATDAHTSTKTAQRFVASQGNEHLSLQIIEECSHLPSQKGLAEIVEYLRAIN